MNDFGNPYMPQNYYPQYPQRPQPAMQQPLYGQPARPQQPRTNADWVPVNGIQGAREQMVQAGCSCWMMDNNDSIIYYKAVDEIGKPTLRAFRLTEVPAEDAAQQPAPQIDPSQFVSREEFAPLLEKMNRLEKLANDLGGINA